METRWKLALVIALTLSLGACSGSKKADDEEAGSDETISNDAGTDAVPKDSAEALPDPDQATQTADAGLDALPTDDKKEAETVPPETTPTDTALTLPTVASDETTDYTVQSGDTLMKIAFETYGDLYQWRKIYDLNSEKITDINRLQNGIVLKVEKTSGASIDRNGEKYLIKSGDTLGSISDDVYGTERKWRKLYENNRKMIKDNPNKIYAGFYLYYQMTDEDQREKEQFLQNKKHVPMAGSGAPARKSVQSEPAPSNQPTDSGLIDPNATGQTAPASDETRAPSSVKTR